MYWDQLVVDDQFTIGKTKVQSSNVKREYLSKKNVFEKEKEYVTSGFYRVDDRLYPTKTNRTLNFMMGNEADIPPVKVSIPFSKLSKTCKTYVPKTRLDYDPKDSVDIADYLYKGNIPHLGKRKKAFKALASIKDSKVFK